MSVRLGYGFGYLSRPVGHGPGAPRLNHSYAVSTVAENTPESIAKACEGVFSAASWSLWGEACSAACSRPVSRLVSVTERVRLQGAGEVEEQPLVIVAEVGQVVREVGEVVTEPELEVIAEVT